MPRIGVLQTPSTDWICSILAIQRIGCAYVPLDLKSGIPRLAAILSESRASFILVADDTIQHVPALGLHNAMVINISQLPDLSMVTIANQAQPESVAIILFTSGSTGTPKGIALNHRSLQNQMEGAINLWGFKSEVVLQQSAYSFDLSVWQIYLALLSGGTSVVAPNEFRNDPVALADLIAREGVTATCGVPSEYLTWFRFGDNQSLRKSRWTTIVAGGEQFSEALVQELRHLGKQDLKAINLYGPAEATVSATQIEVPYQKTETSLTRVAAGHAMPNYAIYILDGDDPVPAGVPGEIAIGGAISSGYINNEQLNQERFVSNPFASSNLSAKGWTTLHRSGDRGRLRLSDGALIFEGRIAGDTQIKLRGVRIELRDIESTVQLAARGHLDDVIVSVRGQPEYLVAHAVFSHESSVAHHLRDQFLVHLLSDLEVPSYMKPAFVIPLEHIPLTVSGKVDRIAVSRLPIYESTFRQTSTNRSLSDTETALKSIWTSLLPEDVFSRLDINPQTDFFQAGGSSLLLINLQAAIKDRFSVSISLLRLFETSSLEQMAAAINNQHVSTTPPDINWEAETELEPEIQQPEAVVSQGRRGPQRFSVLLTGSTGFLGKKILKQLVRNQNVVKIYAVAVRKPVGEASSKVESFKGDLTLPLLGLEEKDAIRIFSEATAIIHNGADVSFMKTYQSLKAANLNSTKELVRLAATYGTGTSFHYISTAGVAQLIRGDILQQASVASNKPPTDGSNGYVATKWASERFLEQVSEALRLPIYIHRPSSVYGEGAPSSDIIQNLLHLSRELKTVPELPFWSGYIDLVSVESVASKVLARVLEHDTADSGPTYVHHSGEVEIPVRGLKEYLEKESGALFETTSPEVWVERARALGLNELVASYMLSRNGGMDLKTPRIGR